MHSLIKRHVPCLMAALLVVACGDELPEPLGPDSGITPPADGGSIDGAPVDSAPADGEPAGPDGSPEDGPPGDGPGKDAGGPPPCTAPTNKALRIFFIGNSFTLGGPIPTLVGSMAGGAGFPKPHIEYSAVGGYTLSKHRALASSTNGVAKGNWDYVVLQEYSTKPTDNAGDPPGFKKDATWFYDQAKKASPKSWVMMYETWSRHPDHSIYKTKFKNPAEMQAQLRKHYNDVAKNYIPKYSQAIDKTQVKVAPAGDAWEKHLAQPKPLRLHAPDDYHASKHGAYLNAAVIFSSIYGCRAKGLSSLSLTAADAARLQASADVTTGIKGVPPGPGPGAGFPVGSHLRVDFGSVKTSASGWNNISAAKGSLVDAVSSTGKGTSVDLVITDSFTGGNTSGRKDNLLGWPAAVSQDTLWAGSFSDHAAALKDPATLELRDLPAGTYTVELFASRAGKDGNLDRLARYTMGGAHRDLDATDNQKNKAVFANVSVGKAGTLALGVAVSPAGTARFAYLGALVIHRNK